MRLLIVTQEVDTTDRNLGFFVRWIEEFAKHTEVTVIEWRTGSRLTRFFRYQYLLLKHLPSADGVFFHMCPEYALAAHFLPMLFRVKTALWYVHKEVSVRLWLAEKLVDRIFTASPESFRLQSKKVAVTGHGIDTELFKPPATLAGGLRLVTVGRISPVKDLRTLIFGLLELRKKYSGATLSLIGIPIIPSDREYEQELKRLVTAGVHWSNLPFGKIYEKTYTAFVHASQTGSVDKAVLEALAAGLPVFTSSEAFNASIPGIFKFRQGDPNDLAENIARAFESGELVVSGEGRQFVKTHHSLPHLITQVLSFYADKDNL